MSAVLAETLADGVDKAFEAIASGAARAKVEQFVSATKSFA
jgi:anthranilate phosphoribosyltransferase